MPVQRRIRRPLAVVAAALIALSACGSSPANRSGIDPAAQGQLRRDVLAVANAVAAHNTPAAQAALSTLNADLAAAAAAGKLDASALARIRAAAATVAADLTGAAPTPTTTPTATVTVPPSPTRTPSPSKTKPSKPGKPTHSHGHGGGDSGGN